MEMHPNWVEGNGNKKKKNEIHTTSTSTSTTTMNDVSGNVWNATAAPATTDAAAQNFQSTHKCACFVTNTENVIAECKLMLRYVQEEL